MYSLQLMSVYSLKSSMHHKNVVAVLSTVTRIVYKNVNICLPIHDTTTVVTMPTCVNCMGNHMYTLSVITFDILNCMGATFHAPLTCGE